MRRVYGVLDTIRGHCQRKLYRASFSALATDIVGSKRRVLRQNKE